MFSVRKKMLNAVYLTSMVFFVLSACYIVAVRLYRAGQSWVVITPVSAYSVQVVFLLILWYLFAVYRGVAGDQKADVEHPFTTTGSYQVLYKLTPLLGALAGAAAAWGFYDSGSFLLVVTAGAVFMTFFVWIFLDPVMGLLEMLLPSSRVHRRKRVARARREHRKQRIAHESLLRELEQIEEIQFREWDKTLTPVAHKLAGMVCSNCGVSDKCKADIVDVGVWLWQYGGLECMKYVHSKAIDLCRNRCRRFPGNFDCIALSWQGIGAWRTA